ncbi:MAG: hypothetical protein B2I18_06835 [Cuniculiplasma sp. C_DKE]|jgi:hypothetical protein|uniref:Multipass membrane protein n=1 Tax=Cuniculiplasma divulgatum TaxID=1673428 RepID=A0A1R4A5E6_9ARCH|nr:hypothetical protein [Cuniculiplasma divulgatum]EQB69155.1 MAG: hypothetical protein AMDU5_GPLC00004G0125 [Thermoplasmatales archaeon Gpl]MCI2412381.1 hypothetical protein [Cuniculiplasma sp.]OWP54916.1 MAG: hypothetical protein B2I18_06835 [Cuniculiplasma sp. C_DKE]WMT48543.1 MAG: hypothetical protein RE472_05555 [Thermoplasmatales archaeon]SJK84198.1 multipass membrane protein [Cuniculiplasma divulgatum]
MNLKHSVLAIAISAILSILLAFFLKDAVYVVISAVPLAIIKKKWAAIYGFLIGFLSFMSVYLLYPFSSSVRISTVVGSVTSIPSVLVLILYPLLGGIICGFSALLFSSLYELSGKKDIKKLAKVKNI